MKLASLREGRDGRLLVVSRDLTRAAAAGFVGTLQAALDDWERCAPRLENLYKQLCDGALPGAFALDLRALAAPLPRAYQWADGSAYVRHVELTRRARGAELPASFWTDPLMYQGGSDALLGACEPIEAVSEAHGIDLEAEVAVITRDVAMATPAERAGERIALFALVNDVSLRELIPAELAKGFGFFQGKPSSALSPVAVTPDELGAGWDGRRVHGAVHVHVRGERLGAPDAGVDMVFDFPTLIAHAAATRRLGAGTLIGGGTISNATPGAGSACLVERRMLETLEHGAPRTPFLRFGDRVRIEMLDASGASIFGAIDQVVVRHGGAPA
jgi:fumarylacetoacetate (FAA) hydrolase